MNIQEAKELVLNHKHTIWFDNNDITHLRKVLIELFPKDDFSYRSDGTSKYYFKLNSTQYTCVDYWAGESIPLSSITFDNEITVEQIKELRKRFPNNIIFADKFDELINNQK